MKLYLFGGAEIGQIPEVSVASEKLLMKKTLIDLNPNSILEIPFAGVYKREGEWKTGWFEELMRDTNIPILDARKPSNLDKASDAVIFIPGGHLRRELLETIQKTPKLLDLIFKAEFIVAESSGSMIMGEYTRPNTNSGDDALLKSLAILKNTVIEPHYTQRHWDRFLYEDMKKSGVKYGVGIDCVTAMVVDPSGFPAKWEKIGNGDVHFISAPFQK